MTGVSGRGVGMDAARSMIGAMNGVIDIQSEVGRGTTFTFKIPLTLAIIQALLVTIGETIYALPLEAVVEIMSVTPEMIDAREGHAAIPGMRASVIRLVDLQRCHSYPFLRHAPGRTRGGLSSSPMVSAARVFLSMN